jgi:hypothetical protein
MAGRKRKPAAKASGRPGKRSKDNNGDQKADEAQEMPMNMHDEDEEGQDSDSELRTQ